MTVTSKQFTRVSAAGYFELSPQFLVCWMLGQGRSAYEQNTQQSPGLGFRTVLQPGHSWKNMQRSVGMVSDVACPQTGQVITALSSTRMMMPLLPSPIVPQNIQHSKADPQRQRPRIPPWLPEASEGWVASRGVGIFSPALRDRRCKNSIWTTPRRSLTSIINSPTMIVETGSRLLLPATRATRVLTSGFFQAVEVHGEAPPN